MPDPIRIGMIPFGDDSNPYQELTRRLIVQNGGDVRTFAKSNFFPLSRAALTGVDVLHVDWPHSFYRGKGWIQTAIKRTMYAIQLAHLRNAKIVWTVHNLQEHNRSGVNKQLVQLAKTAKAIVTLHSGGETRIREQYRLPIEKPIFHIPLGHFADWYQTDMNQTHIRKKWDISEKARVGLIMGRLQPYKGIENLIPAFLNSAESHDHLLIAGSPQSPDYLQKIQALCKDDPRIKIVGRFLSKQELEELMTCADYGVFPFVEIFNSASILTALSFSLPVIASAKGAVTEVVPEQCLFNAGDGSIEQIETALRQMQQTNRLSDLGKQGKDFVLENFGWKEIGARWMDVYRFVLEKV